MAWRRALLGIAYRRASAVSASLRESRERPILLEFRIRDQVLSFWSVMLIAFGGGMSRPLLNLVG